MLKNHLCDMCCITYDIEQLQCITCVVLSTMYIQCINTNHEENGCFQDFNCNS